ncbi:hypothetical protein JCM15765_18260 [Paradesulfitobacterium aromaticivorans]
MDKDSLDNMGDVHMAIAKEPKNRVQQNTSSDHNRKISKAIKEVTSQHSKLLKKLAE